MALRHDNVLGMKCVLCGAEYAMDEHPYVCPRHGSEGILDVVYDYEFIRKHLNKRSLERNANSSIWRYFPLLPIADPECALQGGQIFGKALQHVEHRIAV